MPLTIEEFVSSCNKKRRNLDFSIKDEFNNLTLGQQLEIVQSITSTSLARPPAVQGQALGNLSPAQIMAQALQTIIGTATDLDMPQVIEMGCMGELQIAVGKRTSFFDYFTRKNIPIRNEGGTVLISYHKREYQPTITRGDGFTAIEFEIASIREEFLEGLKQAYNSRLANSGRINMTEMIDAGMIYEVSRRFTPSTTKFSFSEKFKLCSNFDGQTSFLHFIAAKMNLKEFKNFTVDVPQAYVDLMNADGKTADEIRTKASEPVSTITDGGINTHTHSINVTIDRSFANIASRFGYGIQQQVDATFIAVDHEALSERTNNTIGELKARLAELIDYDHAGLYEYTAHLLDEVENSYDLDSEEMHKILGFRRFQLETAAALLEDVVGIGFLGEDYQDITVNDQQNNGLTLKEMMAISYIATQDFDRIIIGDRLNEDGQLVAVMFSELQTEEEQTLFKKRIEFKLIDALYKIRRGYNIQSGIDKPGFYEFNSEKRDENVCTDGAAHHLAYCLNGVHSDIKVKIVNVETLKLKIHSEVPNLVNQIIAETSTNDRMRMGGWLADWKSANKMPPELRTKVHGLLQTQFAIAGHPIIEEYREFFPIVGTTDPIIGHAKVALTTCPYPRGRITEVPTGLNVFIAYIDSGQNSLKLPKYMRSPHGDHLLTIVEVLKAKPEVMSRLLEQAYDFRRDYVSVNDHMIHIVANYVEHHGRLLLNRPKALERALEYAHNDPDRFKGFFASLSNIEFISRCSKPISAAIAAAPSRCGYIIKTIPDDKILSFAENIKSALVSVIRERNIAEPSRWNNVEGIFNAIPGDYQFNIVRDAARELTNEAQRDKLYNLLPEDQRRNIKQNINQDSWTEAVSSRKKPKTTELSTSYADAVIAAKTKRQKAQEKF